MPTPVPGSDGKGNVMHRRLKPLSNPWCQRERCAVPPSPELMRSLLQRYIELKTDQRLRASMSFKQWFDVWVSSRRGEKYVGLDDGRIDHALRRGGATMISRPPKKLVGPVRSVVLLADFPDRPHAVENTPTHYQLMLFGLDGQFVSGSMREYYRGISNFGPDSGIDVQGKVFGWFRMPQPLAFYGNGNSGMSGDFPRNAQGMARDAVRAALDAGVDFTPYDALGERMVTALFVIHSGSGAEETGARDDIWSHKWVVPGGMPVGPNLRVQTYLTVPEDCKVGVCAHEWGHLAACWADYYDTGQSADLSSNGLGLYCLMAAGSWGNSGTTPTPCRTACCACSTAGSRRPWSAKPPAIYG